MEDARMDTELTRLTIAEAAERLRTKDISPVEITDAYLDRIERLNPAVNAYVTITAERSREDAKRAEDEIAAGRYRGALHGIPIALKDLYATQGIRTTAGSKILSDWIPEADSTAARKLREAGSILLGKTNTHEFAWGTTTNNPHYGATHNPWDLDRIPGGSSGGSGAAIAASMAAGTLGTDTGGSIRIPAALCGCVGLKPTFGRVSKAGVIPMSWQLDHPGPITQTVEDAAIMLGAIAGYDPADFATVPVPVPDYRDGLRDGIRGLRVGVPRDYFFGLLDEELRAAVEAAIGTLRELGADVRDVEPGLTRALTAEAWTLVVAESQEYHRDAFSTRPEDFGADLHGTLSNPLPDAIGIARSYRASYEVKQILRRALEDVDVLVTPTTMRSASIIGEEAVMVGDVELSTGGAFASLTMPYNIAGLPAIAIPCGFDSAGLPLSLQIAGRPFDEATVLRAAYAYEQATTWHKRRPALG
jgi:aspartyl-tRNA(Asn)/glutamyl-tRNA(Gln) amidotransferase subunit A